MSGGFFLIASITELGYLNKLISTSLFRYFFIYEAINPIFMGIVSETNKIVS